MQVRGTPVIEKRTIDEIFYKVLPFLSGEEMKRRGEEIMRKLPGFNDSWVEALEGLEAGEVSASTLIDWIAGIAMKKSKRTSFPVDMMELIVKEARKKKILPPSPIIFADTNWTGFYFSFLVSPASGRLELWRTDRLGLTGAPMSDWKPWLDGTKKDPKWGVLTQPFEYKK